MFREVLQVSGAPPEGLHEIQGEQQDGPARLMDPCASSIRETREALVAWQEPSWHAFVAVALRAF